MLFPLSLFCYVKEILLQITLKKRKCGTRFAETFHLHYSLTLILTINWSRSDKINYGVISNRYTCMIPNHSWLAPDLLIYKANCKYFTMICYYGYALARWFESNWITLLKTQMRWRTCFKRLMSIYGISDTN